MRISSRRAKRHVSGSSCVAYSVHGCLREFLADDEVELVMRSAPAFWQAFNAGTHIVDGVPDSVLDAMVDNLTFTAAIKDLDYKIDKLHEFAAAGLSGISLRLYQDPADSIRLLGERVIPALR